MNELRGRAAGTEAYRALAPPRQGALGGGLAEPPADSRNKEKVTGVAYLRANDDGTHKVGLYHKNKQVGELDMRVGERRRVDGIEVVLEDSQVVTMRNF